MADLFVVFFLLVLALGAAVLSTSWGIFFALLAIAYLAIRWSTQRSLEEQRWQNTRRRIESLESELKQLWAMRAATPEAKPAVTTEPKPAEAPPVAAAPPKPAPIAEPPKPAAPQPPVTTPPSPPKPVVDQPITPPKPSAPPAPLAPEKIPAPPKPVPPASRAFEPPVVAPPPPMPAPSAQASARMTSQVAAPAGMAAPPKKNAGLEELIGTNWLPKLGVALIVGGLVSLLIYKWSDLWPSAKLAVGFVSGFAMLGGGVFLERRERYQLFARSCIGGGWAMIFFTTFAMYHIGATRVLSSPVADLFLMIAVAATMVVHTLKYKSQLATGFAFLLGYASIALNAVGPDGMNIGVPGLAASVILAAGLVIVVAREGWFELEVLGIVATYLNHWYWLRPIIEPMGGARHPFPEFLTSAVILCLYWAVFRGSYILRTVKTAEQESISTVAALLNSFFFLGVMRYQSVHPELAFWFLLVLGAVEITLGMLPVTRRRRTAFVVLVTVGAALMVAAMPFRYADHPSRWAVLWLVEAEAFFLAGVFIREIVFRRLGLATALLVAIRVLVTQQYHAASDAHQAVIFGLAAVVFLADSLFVPRRWPNLFDTALERFSLRALTWVGGIMAFAGVWVALPDAWVAVGWAAVAVLLAILAREFTSLDLSLQSHGFATVAFIRLLAVNLELPSGPTHLNLRLITMAAVAAALYACAAWSGIYDETGRRASRALHNTAASFLVALLVFYECPQPWIPVAWLGLALAWALVGRRFELSELSLHGFAIALAGLMGVVTWDFDVHSLWHGAPLRIVLLLLAAAGYYALASYHDLPWLGEVGRRRLPRQIHNAFGCYLLAMVVWYEVYDAWIVIGWMALCLAFTAVGRRLRLAEFSLSAHVLAVVALARTLYVNFSIETLWHGLPLRLVTVVLFTAGMYLMAAWGDVPEWPDSRRLRHIYTWASAYLVMALMWYELQPIGIAVGWMLFALVLFEVGVARTSKHLRWQGYFALFAAFGRVFYANLNAAIIPATYTVVPLAIAFFYVYARLQSPDVSDPDGERRFHIGGLHAYLGTVLIVALLRFQLPAESVIVAWAAVVVILTAAAWRLGRRIFLHQALLLTAVLVFRAVLLNLQIGSEEAGFHFHEVGYAVALLFVSLLFAFQLRDTSKFEGERTFMDALRFFDRHPEQWLFFAPLFLLTVFLATELQRSLVTLAWGLEGVAVFLVALWLGERSYRLSGLGLLMLCVGKILVQDVWRLQGVYRFLTLTVLGCALLLVSSLYIRYKEAFRRIL